MKPSDDPSGAGSGTGTPLANPFMPVPQEPPKPAGRTASFLVNFALLVAVWVLALIWFNEHLDVYVNKVALIGGGVSLWAVARMAWTAIEKTTKTDAWDISRRFLTSGEVSRLLIVALGVLVGLWFTTSSQYFEYDGPGGSEASFTVQVLHGEATDKAKPLAQRSSFAADVTLSPNERVAGRTWFWRRETLPLTCVLQKKGFPYLPLDCSLHPHHSTKVKVPGAFTLKRGHLINVVPSPDLYGNLPGVEASSEAMAYRLKVKIGNTEHELDSDLRKRALAMGGSTDEMAELVAMQSVDDLNKVIRTELAARGLENIERTLAVLIKNRQLRATRSIEEGDSLSFMLEKVTLESGKVVGVQPIFTKPFVHKVTASKVQTIWLPDRWPATP